MGDVSMARVSGDMDYQTASALDAQFTGLIAGSGPFVVLDLSAVTFCDSAGLSVLLRAWRLADAAGAVLVLACVPEPLRRVLAMTGADHVLRVFGTVTDAAADYGG
ncbi:STAS domain-containing protein [Streptomyces sp. NPDC007851]|uniref:STAS domain-containing protein n=1 Tax=Streptomyces sp. NPDC007851 TaxID=3155008 RepID=UPI0033D644AF